MLYMAHLRGDIFIQDGFTGWFYWMVLLDGFTGWLVGWLVQDDHWPPNVAIGPFRGAAINLNISLIITKKYCVVKTIQKQL